MAPDLDSFTSSAESSEQTVSCPRAQRLTEGYSFSFSEVSSTLSKADKESTGKQICPPTSLVTLDASILNRMSWNWTQQLMKRTMGPGRVFSRNASTSEKHSALQFKGDNTTISTDAEEHLVKVHEDVNRRASHFWLTEGLLYWG